MNAAIRHYNSERISEDQGSKYETNFTSLSSPAFQLLSRFLQSPRQVAKLEESLIKYLSENVKDPVFQERIPPQFRCRIFF